MLGRVTGFLWALAAASCAAPPAPYSNADFRGVGELLLRIEAAGRAETIASPEMLRRVLGLPLERVAENGYRIDFNAPDAPRYLAAGIWSSAHLLVREGPDGGGVSGRHSAMLRLPVNEALYCITPEDIHRRFGGRAELHRGETTAGTYQYISINLRNSPPVNIWFRYYFSGRRCLNDVIINENCFTPYGTGCRFVNRVQPPPPERSTMHYPSARGTQGSRATSIPSSASASASASVASP